MNEDNEMMTENCRVTQRLLLRGALRKYKFRSQHLPNSWTGHIF